MCAKNVRANKRFVSEIVFCASIDGGLSKMICRETSVAVQYSTELSCAVLGCCASVLHSLGQEMSGREREESRMRVEAPTFPVQRS